VRSTGIRQRFRLILLLLLVMLTVHLANAMLGGALHRFGIAPRVYGDWWHIYSAPFLHGDWAHLLNNLSGLAIFSAFCLIRSIGFYLAASLFIITVTGLLVFFFARPALHIGASGWIFGLWSLSIAMAWFDRSGKHLVIAALVCLLYGGMIHGILPAHPGVSFESHLFGAASGVLFVYGFRYWSSWRRRKR
jgi:membrane associated rhomboid family serine protease